MAYVPIVPDGLHLGTSRLVDDAVVGHLFDNQTNELKGHAAWRWVADADADDDGRDAPPYRSPDELTPEEREAAILFVAIIVIMVARAASPHVRRWWNTIALPALRTRWQRLRLPRGARTVTSSADHGPQISNRAIQDLLSTLDVTMSREKWNRGYRKLLEAGSFTTEQLSVLKRANFEEDGSSPSSLITETEFADRLQLVLEANPSVLTHDTRLKLERELPLELKR